MDARLFSAIERNHKADKFKFWLTAIIALSSYTVSAFTPGYPHPNSSRGVWSLLSAGISASIAYYYGLVGYDPFCLLEKSMDTEAKAAFLNADHKEQGKLCELVRKEIIEADDSSVYRLKYK